MERQRRGSTEIRERFARTQEFGKRALADGANEKVGEESINIFTDYIYTDNGLRDTGEIFGINYEKVRKVVNETGKELWRNASPATQAEFPLESLVFAKPPTQKRRERMSEARGGVSIFYRELLNAGKSIQEIREEHNLQGPRLAHLRKTLQGWDNSPEVPYIKTSRIYNSELEKKLRDAVTDAETQDALNQVKIALYEKLSKGENPLLVSVTDLIKEAGFHIRDEDLIHFIDVLTDAKIPKGQITREITIRGKKEIQTHIFIKRGEHALRATEALLAAENLQGFLSYSPRQIYGPSVVSPSTTLHINKERFKSVGSLLYDLGIINTKASRSKIRTEIFSGSDCPVPIFLLRNKSWFYPPEREEELKEFIQERFSSLSGGAHS